MKEPEFWEDIISEVPVIVDFKNNWRQVLEELQTYLSTVGEWALINYPNIRVGDTSNGVENLPRFYSGTWKNTVVGIRPDDTMMAWGGKFIEDYVKKKFDMDIHDIIPSVREFLPTIHRISKDLEEQGHLYNGFVSILSPGTSITPHRGDEQNRLMRIHLGLVCDPECKITVGDVTKTWHEGEIVAFKDGGPYLHSVEHRGTVDRWVFIFDLTLDYLRTVVDHPAL